MTRESLDVKMWLEFSTRYGSVPFDLLIRIIVTPDAGITAGDQNEPPYFAKKVRNVTYSGGGLDGTKKFKAYLPYMRDDKNNITQLYFSTTFAHHTDTVQYSNFTSRWYKNHTYSSEKYL